ncbi:MAG TPA: hypothetical protein VFZ59_14975 [Verrucomicrobiae bacterium]|nr:hypothetical protein [Verrucomicrobiae bacterium]
MANTIRFGDLVRSAGRPQTFTLWSGDPKKDRTLQQAIRKKRVLTVFQEPTSTRKPFGRIGYHQKDSAIYLLFPRSLPPDTESRVIGINFDLLDEPVAKTSAPKKTKKVSPDKPPVRVPQSRPQKEFRVTLRRQLTKELVLTVTAPHQSAARQEALETARNTPLEFDPAEVQIKIVNVSAA